MPRCHIARCQLVVDNERRPCRPARGAKPSSACSTSGPSQSVRRGGPRHLAARPTCKRQTRSKGRRKVQMRQEPQNSPLVRAADVLANILYREVRVLDDAKGIAEGIGHNGESDTIAYILHWVAGGGT